LQLAAQCIGESLRASDVLGRVVGEAFSVFLPSTEMNAAALVAEKTRKAIEWLTMEVAPATRIGISPSIGVARNRDGEQTLKDIQQQEDVAMYQAKRGGRNRVSCFESERLA